VIHGRCPWPSASAVPGAAFPCSTTRRRGPASQLQVFGALQRRASQGQRVRGDHPSARPPPPCLRGGPDWRARHCCRPSLFHLQPPRLRQGVRLRDPSAESALVRRRRSRRLIDRRLDAFRGGHRLRRCGRAASRRAQAVGLDSHTPGVLPAWKELIEETLPAVVGQGGVCTETLAAGISTCRRAPRLISSPLEANRAGATGR